MSAYSRDVLSRIDYDRIRQRRLENFRTYEAAFGAANALPVLCAPPAVPFCYPLLTRNGIDREACHQQGIYFPLLWPEVVTGAPSGFAVEKAFAAHLLPLPLDHRYGAPEIAAVIDVITKEILP